MYVCVHVYLDSYVSFSILFRLGFRFTGVEGLGEIRVLQCVRHHFGTQLRSRLALFLTRAHNTHTIPGERDGFGVDVRTAMQWQVHCSSLSDQSAGAATRHARHPHR